jgi:sortase A
MREQPMRADQSRPGPDRVDQPRGDRPEPEGFAIADPVISGAGSASGFVLDALRQRRAGRRILSAVIGLLFVSGAGMFAYPFFTDVYTGQVVQRQLSEEFERFQNVQIETFDDYRANVETGRALTKIVIPAIGVETLVVEGTSPEALRAGAGHYPTTALPGEQGNVGIAGHRTTYGRPFNLLDQLGRDDRVWLITPIGEYEYAVAPTPEGWSSNPYITHPNDWGVVQPTAEASLTLTTCHPKGSAAQRLIVRARLVGSHPPGTYRAARAAA